MKDRITLEIRSNKCNNCLNDCRRKLEEKITCELRNNLTPKLNYKQIPDTWYDLRKLCQDLKNENISTLDEEAIVYEIKHEDKYIYLEFYNNGKIVANLGDDVIAENRTPAQMWEIIKNLIG